MSLQAFQRAVVDLTLSYTKAGALRDGDTSVLAGYDLTVLERDRLNAIVRQPGIAIHCSLSRGNRLEAVFNTFPMTCILLESKLRALVDELWAQRAPTSYQLAGEDVAFAEFVGAKVACGELRVEYLPEILAYEVLCLELMQRSWRQVDHAASVEGILEFWHWPDDLLQPLARLTLPPPGLRAGRFRSRVRLRRKRFEVEVLAVGSDQRGVERDRRVQEL